MKTTRPKPPTEEPDGSASDAEGEEEGLVGSQGAMGSDDSASDDAASLSSERGRPHDPGPPGNPGPPGDVEERQTLRWSGQGPSDRPNGYQFNLIGTGIESASLNVDCTVKKGGSGAWLFEVPAVTDDLAEVKVTSTGTVMTRQSVISHCLDDGDDENGNDENGNGPVADEEEVLDQETVSDETSVKDETVTLPTRVDAGGGGTAPGGVPLHGMLAALLALAGAAIGLTEWRARRQLPTS